MIMVSLVCWTTVRGLRTMEKLCHRSRIYQSVYVNVIGRWWVELQARQALDESERMVRE